MSNFGKKEIISKLNRVIYDNSDILTPEQCYYICANKEKLTTLMRQQNQVVFGRRGTGKTTLLKAFSYYINNVYEDSYCACWYTKLDECIPIRLEIADANFDNVVLYSIKKFLEKFLDFLYKENEKIERGNRDYREKEIIADQLLKLSALIENGSKVAKNISESESINNSTSLQSEHEFGANLTSANSQSLLESLHLNWARGKNRKRELASTLEKDYVYQIDIDEIKEAIDSLLDAIGYNFLYICIDEFSQIDRDITYTIQPAVAQILKQLFFRSTKIVVKIASVWNEARMQNRQINGNREGLELGHDIFRNLELDLDLMFKHSNDEAFKFFKQVLLNSVLLYENPISEKEKMALQEDIIKQLFGQDSFRYLICGSQGIPRSFNLLLANCIQQLKDRKSDKITVNIVFQSIINDYIYEVRKRIPYASPICSSIDDYVSSTKHRALLVDIKEYNNAINYFDGLVANSALHQCPSEQLPRILRNKYKMFYVHYGNYLESLKNGAAELSNDVSRMDKGYLFPDLPSDIKSNIKSYILSIPDGALDEIFCTYCQQYFDRDSNPDNPSIYKCPKCNKIISYWR